jgi:hypothetical protein
MTEADLGRLLDQFRVGIDAEHALLSQLAEVAALQHRTTSAADFKAFHGAADERDRLMRSLVALEEDLRQVRKALEAERANGERLEGFDAMLTRHREASALVAKIIDTDRGSLAALADAELARRSAAVGLERGENTLAAYRRVLAPPVASATLVDRRG